MENKQWKCNVIIIIVSTNILIVSSYRCDLGLDALPEGPGVVLVLGGQCVPHPDHVVPDTQRQTPCSHRGEGQGVHKPPQGGQSPTAVQRGQVPAFNLENKKWKKG